MQEKKLSTLMRCHLAVNAILGILSVVCVVLITISLARGSIPTNEFPLHVVTMVSYITIVIALCSGIAYLLKGAGKDVADFYKIFMLFVAASGMCSVIGFLMQMRIDNSVGVLGINNNVIGCVIMLVKVVLLLLLWLGKDIGKMRTWGVFVLIVALDILYGALLLPNPDSKLLYKMVMIIARLVTDVTIAFTIREKYLDKAARGRD